MATLTITSSRTSSVTIPLNIISAVTYVGFAIYCAVILGTTDKDSVSSQIYAFVLTTCIINFIGFASTVFNAIFKNGKASSLLSLITLGLFIWCCVILFDQIGIDNRSNNPFYTVVFVYFIMNVVAIGIAILAIPCICCAMCYVVTKEDEQTSTNIQETIDNLQKTLKALEAMKEPTKNNTENGATAPPIVTSSNITVNSV
jgi:FlaA1/EpsC-like NDP-sugar epimerase